MNIHEYSEIIQNMEHIFELIGPNELLKYPKVMLFLSFLHVLSTCCDVSAAMQGLDRLVELWTAGLGRRLLGLKRVCRRRRGMAM